MSGFESPEGDLKPNVFYGGLPPPTPPMFGSESDLKPNIFRGGAPALPPPLYVGL